jgi:hypothetical protein
MLDSFGSRDHSPKVDGCVWVSEPSLYDVVYRSLEAPARWQFVR